MYPITNALMNSTHIKAREVQLGDNVWEYGIVVSMKFDTASGDIIINDSWKVAADEELMITNRA